MTSTATVSEYVAGLDFPVNKDQLIQQARSKQAPQDVIDTLNKLDPNQRFGNMADLWQAIGQQSHR